MSWLRRLWACLTTEATPLATRISVLNVEPGDVIIIHCPDTADMESIEEIERAVKRVFGEERDVLLMQGVDLSVLRLTP